MKYRDRSLDCEIYETELRKLKRGVPVYYPSPTSGSGDYHVHVGDAGYLDDGTFRSVFNTFANTEETRVHNEKQHGTPEGFVPVPEELTETVTTEMSAPAGSVFKLDAVAESTSSDDQEDRPRVDDFSTGTEQWLDRIRSISRRIGNESSSSTGTKERTAILTIQTSATRISSLHTNELRQYILANYESWYKFMRDDRGYDVHLPDIMFITECELTGKWSTRVWSQATSHRNSSSRVRLGPLSGLFNRSEESRTSCYFPDRYGPMKSNGEMIPDEDIHNNQCIFLKGFWVKDRALDQDSDDENASVIVTMWPEPEPRSSGEDPHEFALNMILNNSKADVAIVHESDVLAVAEAVDFQFEKQPSLKRLQYKGEAIKVVTEHDAKSGKLVGTLVHKDSDYIPSDEGASSESADKDEGNQNDSSGGKSMLQNGLKLWRGKK